MSLPTPLGVRGFAGHMTFGWNRHVLGFADVLCSFLSIEESFKKGVIVSFVGLSERFGELIFVFFFFLSFRQVFGV